MCWTERALTENENVSGETEDLQRNGTCVGRESVKGSFTELTTYPANGWRRTSIHRCVTSAALRAARNVKQLSRGQLGLA